MGEVLFLLLCAAAVSAAAWITLACIVEAAVTEEHRRALPLLMKAARASGVVDGLNRGYWHGFHAAADEAKRKATEFREAQQYNWLGPKVEHRYIHARVRPEVLGYPYEHFRDTAPEVRFSAQLYEHSVNGAVFRHARWELEGVEAQPLPRRRCG